MYIHCGMPPRRYLSKSLSPTGLHLRHPMFPQTYGCLPFGYALSPEPLPFLLLALMPLSL